MRNGGAGAGEEQHFVDDVNDAVVSGTIWHDDPRFVLPNQHLAIPSLGDEKATPSDSFDRPFAGQSSLPHEERVVQKVVEQEGSQSFRILHKGLKHAGR